MSKYDPLIAQMRQELIEITALWSGVGMRQVRVTHHPPGGQPVDITQQHADAVRKAADSLHKAIVILEGLDT
jgi:hypothetical protein